MPSLRLATFNCENLMMRCDFSATGLPNPRQQLTNIHDPARADAVDAVFDVLSEDDRTLTAQALAQTRADVCALQEVENLITLTAFDTRYMARWAGRPFGNRILHEGNDQRGIDVGILSRLPIERHISHATATYRSLGLKPPLGQSPNQRIFRRDCLEVDILKDGQSLTLFICHLKSMHGGRDETRATRETEASAIRCLIERRFPQPETAEWIVLGDFNDYAELGGVPLTDHGLSPLLNAGFAVDLATLCMPDAYQRWSHHYAADDTYGALDHILLSPRLAAINRTAPVSYVRAGMPYRAVRHKGFRFPGIGWAHPKASDHCPLVATIQFEGHVNPP